MAYGFSAVLPLQKSSEDGFYALTKTLAENTKQNLKNLLLTSPGERVMMPDFGVGLRRKLFSNAGDSIEAEITAKIENQVEKYMPFVTINDIKFFKFDIDSAPSTNAHKFDIQIFYSMPQFNLSDLLKIIKMPLE